MTAIVVSGALLAASIATWMWTWWWNRYVVHEVPEPDYLAAMRALTLMLIETPRPLYARREQISKAVVDIGSRLMDRDLTITEINALTNAYFAAEVHREGQP
jgi:hypothetical protein